MRGSLFWRGVTETTPPASPQSRSTSALHVAWQLKTRCNHALRTLGASVPPEVFVYRGSAYHALGKPYFALADYDTAAEALGSGVSHRLQPPCLRALEHFPATQTGVYPCTDAHLHLFVQPFLDNRCAVRRFDFARESISPMKSRISATGTTAATASGASEPKEFHLSGSRVSAPTLSPTDDTCANVHACCDSISSSVSCLANPIAMHERGLFAVHTLPADTPVITCAEAPWLRYPTQHECCAHCTKPLPPRAFSCRNSRCHEEYCSRECRESAMSSYHAVVCYNEHFQSIELDLYERLSQAARRADAVSSSCLSSSSSSCSSPTHVQQQTLHRSEHGATHVKQSIQSEFDTLAAQLLLLRVVAVAMQNGKAPSAMAELSLLSGRMVFSPQEASHSLRQLYHRLVRALHIRTSFSYEEMFAVLARVTANCVQTTHGIELSLPCAMMNHSCQPNVRVGGRQSGVDGGRDVVTLREIAAGEELTRNYVALGDVWTTLPWKQRQTILKETYGFDCSCGLCVRQRGVSATTADKETRTVEER